MKMFFTKYFRRSCCNFQRIKTILREKQPGDDLGVRGWINNVRRLKNHIFVDINDGSSAEKLQIMTDNNENSKQLTAGNLIHAEGILQVAPRGNYELHAHTIQILADGHFTSGYPFIPKHQHPPDYVRDFLHLRSRIDYIAAIMRLRHRVQKALHDFMDANDFIQINTPIITTNDCEGAGEVFTLQPENKELLSKMHHKDVPIENSYFDDKVYLSVSGQLHLESMSYGLGNTYTLSPAFRAENCKSPLHLSEFYMLEAELVFMNDLNDLCSFIERMLKSITQELLNTTTALHDMHHCQKFALGKIIGIDWLNKSWIRINYQEAFAILEEERKKLQTTLNANDNFSKEQELFLVEYFKSPVFVMNWPSQLKPFYMMASRQHNSVVHAVDLLMPTIGELCGGGLRESDEERLKQHTQLPANLKWYVELRKYGSAPTGGFGMGFERYLQLLTGIKNIRDVIPFPRYPHSCKM